MTKLIRTLALLYLLFTSVATATDIPQIVWLAHRVNVYPCTDCDPPDTASFETLLDEVIDAGAYGVIMGQWSKKWPYFEDTEDENALKAKIESALDTCDAHGLKVWFHTTELSKISGVQAPTYYPTITPDTSALEADTFDVDTVLTPTNYLLKQAFTPDSFRYYDYTYTLSETDNLGDVGTIGFYRYSVEDDEYLHAYHYDLDTLDGTYSVRFHALDNEQWEAWFIVSDTARVTLGTLVERSPDSLEDIGSLSTSDAAFWGSALPMYKCHIDSGGNGLDCDSPDLSSACALCDGSRIAIQQWNYLKGTSHTCLEGWWGSGDEPQAIGYQRGVLDNWGSAGAAYAHYVGGFCELGRAVTGKDVLVFADAFDYSHNGRQYIRTNNPESSGDDGGFYLSKNSAWNVLLDTIPAIYCAWNADVGYSYLGPGSETRDLAASVEDYSESDRRWWLALYLEYNNTDSAAELIEALPQTDRPEAIMWFTWDMTLVRADSLSSRFAKFNFPGGGE